MNSAAATTFNYEWDTLSAPNPPVSFSFPINVEVSWYNTFCPSESFADTGGTMTTGEDLLSTNPDPVTILATPASGGFALSTKTTFPPDSNYGGAQMTVTASGFLTTSVSLSTNALNFSPQPLNTTSHRQKIGLINASSSTVTISKICTDPDLKVCSNAEDVFALGRGTASEQATMCQPNTPVPGGGTCDIYVTFTPSTTGTTTGELSIIDDAANSPQTAVLTGTTGCNANTFVNTYGQYQYSPTFQPASTEWIPQTVYPSASGGSVPQYFGYLPADNGSTGPWGGCPKRS